MSDVLYAPPKADPMKQILPIILTILLAGAAGFALARATSGLEARIAASSAAEAAAQTAPPATTGCPAHAEAVWAAGPAPITVRADAVGPACTSAVVLLSMRSADGAVLYANAYNPTQVMTLAGAASGAESLADALATWIDPESAAGATGTLPAWAAGAEGPDGGEFPFMPEAWLDQSAYSALRAENVPTFCIVQGMESLLCLSSRNGGIEPIGVQMFPG